MSSSDTSRPSSSARSSAPRSAGPCSGALSADDRPHRSIPHETVAPALRSRGRRRFRPMQRRYRFAALALFVAGAGCSGDDNANPVSAPDASLDATKADVSVGDEDDDEYDAATADGGDASSTN